MSTRYFAICTTLLYLVLNFILIVDLWYRGEDPHSGTVGFAQGREVRAAVGESELSGSVLPLPLHFLTCPC